MADTRHKNANWMLPANPDGRVDNTSCMQALLMDIRDELQTLNRVFACPNFTDIPRKLDRIVKNTTKRRKRRG